LVGLREPVSVSLLGRVNAGCASVVQWQNSSFPSW
jgi:hypothetical protein